VFTPRLVLSLPPRDNHSHQSSIRWHDAVIETPHGPAVVTTPQVYRGRTQNTREYVETVQWEAIAWMRQVGWVRPETNEKVRLYYWVFWPDHRTRDPANLLKVLQDSLKEIVVPDDNQWLPWAMDYTVDRAHLRLELRLKRLTRRPALLPVARTHSEAGP